MFKKLFSLLTLGSLAAPLTHADAMVWKVSNAQGELYLGGTIHMLRPSDYPLKPEYDVAFKDSQVIVLETDPAATQDFGFQQQMLMRMSLPPGQTLSSILSPATYSRLQTFAKERGMPIEMMQSFKPAMAVLSLTVMELQRMGMSATSGLETFFAGQARLQNKTLASLETPEEQLQVIARMGDGYENAFVNGSLDDFEQLEKEFDQLIAAWKRGDTLVIEEKMTRMMKQRFPDMYNSLLVQRNFNWLSQIKKFIQTPEKEFILVGAAHLVGPDSVPTLLEAQGFKVERLKLP